MSSMKTMFNLSTVRKICLAGLFIALVVIFNKVIAINYIAFIPFVRISFGSIALIIFASIVLGPIYGMVVGAAADVLGYFIFDMSSYGWFPQITLTYALLGFLPYFIWKLVMLIKNQRTMKFIEYGVFAGILIGISVFFAFNSTLHLYGTTYDLEVYQRVLIPVICLLLFAVVVVVNYLIDRKVKNNDLGINIYQISFIVFICEVLVVFLFGGLMKAWAYGFDMLLAIYICQALIMFFDIPYNSYLIFVMIKLGKRFLER